jgi:magnesium-transporting ATPase (P-type)
VAYTLQGSAQGIFLGMLLHVAQVTVLFRLTHHPRRISLQKIYFLPDGGKCRPRVEQSLCLPVTTDTWDNSLSSYQGVSMLGTQQRHCAARKVAMGKQRERTMPDNRPLDIDEQFERFNVGRNGLDSAEVAKRRQQYGANALQEAQVNPLLNFLRYFWGPIPWMIEVAALLSLVVGDLADFGIIIVMLLFNGLVGFWQEYQASNAIAQLKKNRRSPPVSWFRAISSTCDSVTSFPPMSCWSRATTSASTSRPSPANPCLSRS